MRASQLAILCIAAALAACSYDEVPYTPEPVSIGGTITGLDGPGLVLTNNGGDDLAIAGNGAFMFATPLERGTSYALAVKSQPSNPTQLCSLTNSSGIAGDEDVLDIQVSCQTRTFRVSGTVTGLAGAGLMLQNNGGDTIAMGADGAFMFATPILSGTSYDVTIAMQPSLPTQACEVTGGAGTVGGGDITDVQVTCTTSTFTIGGTVTGLRGPGLVLQNNGGDDLAVGADGSFTFSTLVTSGQPYEVTLVANPTSPISQTCTVTNGDGIVGSGGVTSVQVTCTTNTFTIGGTLTGDSANGLVLQNNNGDDLTILGGSTFTFATPVASGTTYHVKVKTNPHLKVCGVVLGDMGSVGASNVTSVVVRCTKVIPNLFQSTGFINNQTRSSPERDKRSNGISARISGPGTRGPGLA